MNIKPQEVLRRYYDALNKHDLDALGPVLAPDFKHHGLPGPGDAAAFRAMLIAYFLGFPDLAHRVDDTVVEDDRIAVRITTTGTHLGQFLSHPPTGKTFAASGMGFYTIKGQAIVEIRESFDTLAMLQQLGLYKPLTTTAEAEGKTVQKSPITSVRQAPGPKTDVSLSTIRSDQLAFLTCLVREYGDVVRYVCEGRETVLLNRPKAVRIALHGRAANFSKLNTPDLLLLKPMLGDGLLTTEGPVWRRDREWLQPGFTSRRMAANAGLMVAVIKTTLERWARRSESDPPPQVVQEMSRLTLELAAKVLFSSDFATRSEEFGEAMDVLNEAMGRAEPGAGGDTSNFDAAVALIRRAVLQVVIARQFHDSGEDDVLALLLRAQRERGDSNGQVVDQAVTILLAGHETTAKALSWAIAQLHCNPIARATMQAEVDALPDLEFTAADLPQLRYTRAVVEETLRLCPPIWLLTRTTLADDEIDGFSIPAGALVAISPYLLQRHPDLWDEPERFAPERFLEDRGNAQRFLPFGDGPRHCIGKFFAMLEMPLVLATLFRRYTVEPLWTGMPEHEALVTLRPLHRLPMRIRPRAAGAGAGSPG